jgi:hypothetical protein
MSTRIVDRHYEAALALANRVRKHFGKKPVKRLRQGNPGDAEYCVIAATIDAPVMVMPCEPTKRRITVTDTETDEVLWVESGPANTFALAFDRGELPDLIEPA